MYKDFLIISFKQNMAMKIYSKHLETIVTNIDNSFLKLENNLLDKQNEIEKLKRIINKFHEIHNVRDENGLGVHGVKLLLELRRLDKIDNVTEFLNDIGL